ncbi:MAG: porin family protein [candidate division Zixibacteria bacterium]|nr:porin family protein [candidate division Zixibacteria bacterium]
MKTHFRMGLLTGVALMMLTSAALADGLGFGARYTWVKGTDTHKSSNMLGVLARLSGGMLGVEGAIDYRKDDLGGGANVKTWPVTASLLVYPFPSIYGLAGLGWYNSTLEYPTLPGTAKKTSTRVGYHLGAGIEVPVVPRVKVSGEFRYIFLDYKFEDIPGEVGKRKADAFSLGAAVLLYLQ